MCDWRPRFCGVWNKDKRDIKHQWRAGSRATHFVSRTEKEKWAAANRNSRRVGVRSKRLGVYRAAWLARLLPKARDRGVGHANGPFESSRVVRRR